MMSPQISPRLPEEPRRELVTWNAPGQQPVPIQIQITGPTDAAPAHPEDATGLAPYGQAILRRKWSVALMALVCALAALLIALPQTPVYQARTALEIQGVNENFLNSRDVDPTSSPANSAETYLQTQIRILQEDSMLERVVDKLQLDRRPEFAGSGGSRMDSLRKLLHLAPLPPIPPRERALAMAEQNLRIRPSGQTRIVEILFDSPDPKFASQFANTLASEFIEQNLEARWQATQKTGEWLSRQIGDLKRKLERSQEQLLGYAQAAGLVFTSDSKATVAEEKLRRYQEELSRAQADRVLTQSKYEAAVASPPESLPQVLDSEPLRAAQQQWNDLRRQHAELAAQFTPAYYKVKNVEAQIAELEAILKRERTKVVERIRNEYEAGLRREKLVANVYGEQLKLVSEQAAKSVHYEMLKHEVDTNRGLYEAILQKVKEAGVASAIRASNVRILSPARPPSRPYKPNPPLNAALGLGAGLLAGVVFALNRERAGRSIRSPGDAPLYLNLPELGVIPAASEDLEKRFYGAAPKVVDISPKGSRKDQRVELVTWQRKPSLLAESFRATLASILFADHNGNRPHVIVISSPDPASGKTTMVSNLGIALAEINRKVLLIDADMRKPRLYEIFSVANEGGLGQLLREEDPIENYAFDSLVERTHIPGLYVLPSGNHVDDVSTLLYSDRMAELLWRFRLEFHTVLIDAPPMLHLPDARVLGRQADGVILVLRSAHTSRESALAAAQRLREDGTRVVGTILNQWAPDSANRGYYDYHGPSSAAARPRAYPPERL